MFTFDTSTCDSAFSMMTNVLYPALADTVRRLQTDHAAVMYINGVWRFGPAYVADGEASQRGADAFWEWCDSYANAPPVSFLRGVPTTPGGCLTWREMAHVIGKKDPSTTNVWLQLWLKQLGPEVTVNSHQ